MHSVPSNSGNRMSGRGEFKLYERIAASGPPEGVIRPGGLALTERGLTLCGFAPGSLLLDVGCGTGATVQHLRLRFGFRAAGVDPSPSMLAMGRAGEARPPTICARGESLPFSDSSWDGVLAECSLSLADSPGGFLGECFRVLKSGGKLMLSDIYPRNADAGQPLSGMPSSCCLGGALPRETLVSMLSAAGFSVLAWEDHSATLKHFAGQLILSGVSPARFFSELTAPDCAEKTRHDRAIAGARPGYFLAIAEKPATRHRPNLT